MTKTFLNVSKGGGRRRTTEKEKEEKEKENILFWWGREMMKNKEGYIWSGKIFDPWRRRGDID